MSKLRGRPLNEINRAEMELIEERVEARELARYLEEHEPDHDGPEEFE